MPFLALLMPNMFSRILGGALVAVLLYAGFLNLALAAEKRHSSKVEKALVQTNAAYEAERAKAAVKVAEFEAKARRIERDQVQINQETVSAYQKELAALRARASRVRAASPANPRSANPAGVPQASSGTDGATGEDRLSPSDALIASEIALRLKALQDWITAQEGVQR